MMTRSRDFLRDKTIRAQRPPERQHSRRPAGMIQRAHVEAWLASMDMRGILRHEKNEARRAHVRKKLEEVNATSTEIDAVMKDLPSYPGWDAEPVVERPRTLDG